MLSTTIFHWLWPMAAVVVLMKMVEYYLRHKRYFELGRKLPGPRPLPLVGNALYFLGDVSDILQKINQLVGTRDLAAIWFGPKLVVLVNSPENVEIFFNDPNLLNKSEQYKSMKRGVGNGLVTANDERWKKGRKLIAPTLYIKTLKHFLKTFHHQSEILVHEMRSQVGEKSFDIFSYLQTCTMKIILGTMLQKDVKPEDDAIVDDALETIEKILQLIQERIFKVWLHNDFIYACSSTGRKFDAMVASVKSAFIEYIYVSREDVIQRSDESDLGENVFIRRLLDQYDYNDLQDHIATILVAVSDRSFWGPISIAYPAAAFSTCLLCFTVGFLGVYHATEIKRRTNINAGYDTSSRVLSCLFVMLALHPEIQEKVYQEVSGVHQEAENRHLEVEDIKKLKYLELVIKETLRMFPPVPLIGRTAGEDIIMGKYTIPKGAAVGINIFNIHRSPDSYQHPNKFDPDRFLPENHSKRHPYSFVPFAGGPRICVGQTFAMWSMKVIVSSVLLNYKLECDYKMEDIQVQVNMLLGLMNGYNIKIKNRSN